MKLLAPWIVLSAMLGFSHVASGNALEVGAYAPCTTLEGIDSSGGTLERCIREPEQEGQTLTLLKFFSATCSDCAHLHQQMVDTFSGTDVPGKVQFNLIGIDRNSDLLREYAGRERGKMSALSSTVFIDSDRDAKRAYGVIYTPTVYVLNNTSNRIVYYHRGVMSDGEFNKLVQLLKNH